MKFAAIVGFAILVVGVVTVGSSPADIRKNADPSEALTAADKVILYSIDGNHYAPRKKPKADETFGGYPVLGKLELSKEARAEIVAALTKGINQDGPAKCFIPRHALRAIKGKVVTDYIICFQCNQTLIRANGKETELSISKIAQPALDKHLTAGKIKLAPK